MIINLADYYLGLLSYNIKVLILKYCTAHLSRSTLASMVGKIMTFGRHSNPWKLYDCITLHGKVTADGMCVSFAVVPNFVTPWTTAHQAPLSVGFPRQEYWNDLPFPPPGHLSTQALNPSLLHCRQILYHLSEPPGKPL